MYEPNKILSSITKAESKLYDCLVKFLGGGDIRKSELEVSLEWFITWRIKLETLNSPFWCDGTSSLQIALDDVNKVSVLGEIRLGPESDVNTIFKGQFDSVFTLNLNNQKFDSYSIFIHADGVSYNLESVT